MYVVENIVNLDLPPEQRWQFLAECRFEMDELLQYYLNDFEEIEYIQEAIKHYRAAVISEEINREVEYISSISKFSSDEIMIANLYYDILKFYFGCTGIALYNRETVFHARNLDWHTENNLLAKHTQVFNFQKSGQTIFKTVGWPGFVGALSGTKPGKFSVSLNAILSDDQPEIAYPVSFLIRDVLNTQESFETAKSVLSQTEIVGDCLLLLSGVAKDELVVIERTPKRFEIREAVNNRIVVTNDYRKLEQSTVSNTNSILQETSCTRYDRSLELLNLKAPSSNQDCLQILSDENIKMGITVQQMAFNNITGELEVRKVLN